MKSDNLERGANSRGANRASPKANANRASASDIGLTSSDKLLAYSLRLRSSGLSTIPIRADGSKQPALTSWKEYQRRLPTKHELMSWFGNGRRRGIAVIAGRISGNLEILDLDLPEIIDKWRNLVDSQAPGLLTELPQVKTPSGGLHVLYRCKQIAGNLKLAERETRETEEAKGMTDRKGRHLKFKTAIETRGEGGYAITAGSSGACHHSGKPYVLINGDLQAIPEITEIYREVMLNCAKLFNERIREAPLPKRKRPEFSLAGLRPGDDFNRRGDTRTTLKKHGWRYLRKGPCGELWRRPGVKHTSATLFPDGSLYVFSSNAYPFDHNRRYDKFSIYTLLEHSGDWEAAAKDLAEQGYGGTQHQM